MSCRRCWPGCGGRGPATTRGRVLVDLAVAIADGAEAITDIAVLADQRTCSGRWRRTRRAGGCSRPSTSRRWRRWQWRERVTAAGHGDPVDPQQGAVQDHDRLAYRDFDRLGESRGERGQDVDGLAGVAEHR